MQELACFNYNYRYINITVIVMELWVKLNADITNSKFIYEPFAVIAT